MLYFDSLLQGFHQRLHLVKLHRIYPTVTPICDKCKIYEGTLLRKFKHFGWKCLVFCLELLTPQWNRSLICSQCFMCHTEYKQWVSVTSSSSYDDDSENCVSSEVESQGPHLRCGSENWAASTCLLLLSLLINSFFLFSLMQVWFAVALNAPTSFIFLLDMTRSKILSNLCEILPLSKLIRPALLLVCCRQHHYTCSWLFCFCFILRLFVLSCFLMEKKSKIN